MAAVSVANLHIFCSEISNKDHYHQQQYSSNTTRASRWVCSADGGGLWGDNVADRGRRRNSRRSVHSAAFWQGTAKPTTVEMDPITSTEHLDQILSEAQQASPPKPVIIDWMANWCRKCIYLKPKLEKLAAEYDTRLKFYYVDVNNVSQTLVKRGNISKMPTIQLWKDGEMKEEVIGGHKAWLVIDEVKEMIEKYI